MTTDNETYRSQLLRAAERIQATERQEEARQMTDEHLMGVITTDLGLPAGTPFADEQLEMIAKYQGYVKGGRSND
jgi:hypothetical protein